jgi:TatD DNase family protein
VLTVHSRSAADLVIGTIERYPRIGLPILHWFSGTTNQLERAVAAGCWFSVGPAMMRSTKGRELAAAMPIDRILTETDAPFTRFGDRPMYHPWEATGCVPDLAAAHNLSPEAMLTVIKRNLRTMAEWKPERTRTSGM